MKVNLKTKKARIELIPLLDMIFLVLVSFVYTFLSMTVQKGIPVRLPFAKTAIEDKKQFLVVTVAKNNMLYVNKKNTSVMLLIPELIKHRNLDPEVKVFLNADKDVTYERVIEVLDAIRKAGIGNVSLETALDNEQ